jgi:hypothetical protein
MTLHEPSLSFPPTARVTETEARKALQHLDALTQPGWYDLALAGPPIERHVQGGAHAELPARDLALRVVQHAGALSSAQILGLWVLVADTLTASGHLEVVARLGEALHATLPAHEDVTRRTVEALVLLADDAEPGMRAGWLRRAQVLHPDSEVIARRLELDAAVRSDQRWRLLAAIACGVALVTAAVVALQLPV